MNDIEISYEIEDGYVGGSRPQTVSINPEDFEGLSDDQIREQLADQIQEDMFQTVNAVYEETYIVEQIKAELVKSTETEEVS